MTWKVTLTANRKYDMKSHSKSQPKNMTWKVTLKANRQFSATEKKMEKFAGNASAKIWEEERKKSWGNASQLKLEKMKKQ